MLTPVNDIMSAVGLNRVRVGLLSGLELKYLILRKAFQFFSLCTDFCVYNGDTSYPIRGHIVPNGDTSYPTGTYRTQRGHSVPHIKKAGASKAGASKAGASKAEGIFVGFCIFGVRGVPVIFVGFCICGVRGVPVGYGVSPLGTGCPRNFCWVLCLVAAVGD